MKKYRIKECDYYSRATGEFQHGFVVEKRALFVWWFEGLFVDLVSATNEIKKLRKSEKGFFNCKVVGYF